MVINLPNKVVYAALWVGDYHAPRLLALQDKLKIVGKELVVLQFDKRSHFYLHPQRRREQLIKRLCFREIAAPDKLTARARAVWSELSSIRPEAIFVLGYTDIISVTCLFWAKINGAKIFFFSDSKEDDQVRSSFKELIKGKLIRCFNGAVVAGARHREYFRGLGLRGPIEIGYDVIDNDYFKKRSVRYRNKKSLLPSELSEKYIICVSRLVARKRVDLAIRIFDASGIDKFGYKLIVVGTGPEQKNLEALVRQLHLNDSVQFIQNVPNHRMPLLYGLADALLLTSEYDQWGLCVNEGMACGVPAIVTSRCGVANELVLPHCGFVVSNGEEVAKAAPVLRDWVTDSDRRNNLRLAALDEVRKWSPEKFAASCLAVIKGE